MVVSVALARRPVRGHNVLPGSAGVLRVDVGGPGFGILADGTPYLPQWRLKFYSLALAKESHENQAATPKAKPLFPDRRQTRSSSPA